MKTLLSITNRLLGLIVLGLMLAGGGCEQESETTIMDLKSGKNQLSDSEIKSLMFMVEEEKLARDVYLVMFDKYGLQIFDNISKSEQTHVDALSSLIDKYNLINPTDNTELGEFDNDYLQKLYIDLIELGSTSKSSAIEVGIIIEETDIEDIEKYLDEDIEKEDIIKVYSNLLNGSYNHLDAFVSHLH